MSGSTSTSTSGSAASCCGMETEGVAVSKSSPGASNAAVDALSRYPKMNEVHYNKVSERKPKEIVSESEWFGRMRQQMLEEKALTHHADYVTSRRQQLPWTEIRSDYFFEDLHGKKSSFVDLFTNPKHDELILYVMMLPAGITSDIPCTMCAFWVDNFNGNQFVLQQKTNFAIVAKGAPSLIAELAKTRGWRSDLPLYSAQNSTFLEDLGVALTGAQYEQFKKLIADSNGDGTAALEKLKQIDPNHPNVRARLGEGMSVSMKNLCGTYVFHLDRKTNKIYKTYTSSFRGGEALNAGFGAMDLLPWGREGFYPSLHPTKP